MEENRVDAVEVGVAKIAAQHVNFTDGMAGIIEAGTLEISDSAAIMIQSQTASVKDALAGAIITNTANIQDTQVNVLVAQEIHGGPVRSIILLAGNIEGTVETYLNTRQVLFAGLAAGIGVGFVLLFRQFFTRHKSL
jgi:hypothetical protein